MSKTLSELVCKILGHKWGFSKCERCGKRMETIVYVNGLLMRQGEDYKEGDGFVQFHYRIDEHDHVSVHFVKPDDARIVNRVNIREIHGNSTCFYD